MYVFYSFVTNLQIIVTFWNLLCYIFGKYCNINKVQSAVCEYYILTNSTFITIQGGIVPGRLDWKKMLGRAFASFSIEC